MAVKPDADSKCENCNVKFSFQDEGGLVANLAIASIPITVNVKHKKRLGA